MNLSQKTSIVVLASPQYSKLTLDVDTMHLLLKASVGNQNLASRKTR